MSEDRPIRPPPGNALGNKSTVSFPASVLRAPGSSAVIAAGIGAIKSDARGFSRLGELHRELAPYRGSQITIDLSRLDWFDGHMAAPMKVVLRHAEARGNAITCKQPRPAVETVLRKNGFLPGPLPDQHQTTMPLTTFALEDHKKFALYAKHYLARREMPKMTAALVNKFFEGIDELFANSALHSKSAQGVAVSGQFYPRHNRLDFMITDGGLGIPGSVRTLAGKEAFSDPRAIDWAMQDYNTTRRLDIPGGLGSKILREFVGLNNGKLLIASNGGYWCQTGQNVMYSRLNSAFPGTAVMLEINTADKASYDLVEAPHPRDIW